MRILKTFTSTSTAVVLLLGRRPTPTSAASWEPAAADDVTMSAQRGVPSGITSAGFPIVDSTWAGAAPTSSATTTQPHDLVLPDVQVWNPETRETSQGFTDLRHLWYTPLKQVSAESTSADASTGNDGNDDGWSRWRWFWWEPPTSPANAPDQFMAPFWKALLYVAHVIKAENIRVLLYGSRLRKRRYRRFNPNSRRNRRHRRIMRATADISRILRGFWARAWAAWWSSDGEKRQSSSEATAPCPVGLYPVGPVGLSAWLQIAAPTTTALSNASPPALLTPFEALAALFPSSNRFIRAADAPVDPYPLGLSMASLQRTSDEMVVIPAQVVTTTWLSLPQSSSVTGVCQSGRSIVVPAGGWNDAVRTGVDGLPVACPTERVDIRRILAEGVGLYTSAGHDKVLCVQTRPYPTDAIVTNVYQLGRHLPMPLLSFLLKGYHQASVSSLVLPAAAQRSRLHSAPPVAAFGVPIPPEALSVPCPPGLLGLAAPQHRAPDAVMAAALETATWSFHVQGLVTMDSCQFASVTPEDGWNGTFRKGFCRWSAACRMERVDVCWTLARTVELPPKPVRAQGALRSSEDCTAQDGEARSVDVESDEGSRTCRLSSEVDLLSPAESSIMTCFPLELEGELSDEGSTTCRLLSGVDLLSPAESSTMTCSPLELEEEWCDGGSTTCHLSSGVDPLSPAESSIRTCFPLELEEELRARIAGRGGGEVVLEAVGEGPVEVMSGQGREQPEQGAQALVPRMCERKSPGDLKALFVRNLRKATDSGLFKGACAVRAAQIGLIEDCQLEHVDVLGEGGFGTVSAVRHAVLPGQFALKTLREGASERGRISATVEMAVLARLSLVPHPNVITAVAIDDAQTTTMPILLPEAEFDFHTVLTSGRWAISELLRFVVQVGAGVEHMHTHGISHGDIKPQNILMFRGSDGSLVPQLADFGTARELGESRPKMMGTVGYMPLECMLESVRTNSSQDVWALGAMTLVICAAPDKVQSNMFAHEDLYTDRERACRSFLQTRGPPSEIKDKLRSFECTVTMRTLEDESYLKMLEKESLNVDLGCRGTVSDCLPFFLAKAPENRYDVEVFQKVVGNIAKEVAAYEAEFETYSSQPSDRLDNDDESEDSELRQACL